MTEKGRTEAARRLRRNSTHVEIMMWQRLRNRQIVGAKFVRQLPIGSYIVDFACRSARLVIELDGGQHATSSTDAERTRVIETAGFTVLRFWNHDIVDNLEGVLEEIRRSLLIARG